jgi:hypothetical protein
MDIAPTANNGSAATFSGLAVSGTLSATTSYSGQTLTFSVVSQPGNGTVSITNASTGAYTYTPGSGFAGSDSFTFKVTDAAGTSSNTATVSVTVNDRAATANNGSVTTNVDQAKNGTVFASTAYTGQTLTYFIATQPAHGSVTLTNNLTGSFTYTPATGYVGSDSFTFYVQDAYGTNSNTATESVTVNDVAATANNGSVTTTAGAAKNGTLSATTAYSGQTLTYSVVAGPAHGSVTITNASTGAFTYTPNTAYTGADSFTFKVTDQVGTSSNTATESVTVNDVAATANNGSVTTTRNTAVNGTLSATTAYTGQTLTFSVVTSPAHGTLTITNASTGAFKFTPTHNFRGSDSFTFKVTDQAGTPSNTATESITVN